jgi:hypothetical protein
MARRRRKGMATPRKKLVVPTLDQIDWIVLGLLRPGSGVTRGVLRDIETAVRAGRFSGEAMAPKRIALLNALAGLGESQLSPRVATRYARVYALITGSDPGQSHAP